MHFYYYQDSGHGWIEVPISLLRELGIADKISFCSYQNGVMAYLEEDVDALRFTQAAETAGLKLKIIVIYEEGLSSIRTYREYRDAEGERV
jgi:hypothetical protein